MQKKTLASVLRKEEGGGSSEQDIFVTRAFFWCSLESNIFVIVGVVALDHMIRGWLCALLVSFRAGVHGCITLLTEHDKDKWKLKLCVYIVHNIVLANLCVV